MKELLIYHTVANSNDEIKLSCLFDSKKQKYVMPSLIVIKDKEEWFYADNETYLIELLPVLERFIGREMQSGDREFMTEFADSLGNVYDQLQGIEETISILKYGIETKMLTATPTP